MKDMLFKGCGTALVTPFFDDGSVDYEALASLVDRQVSSGIDFLVPLGTTAETPTLSPNEKAEAFRTVKAHAAGKPLLAGAGSNSLTGTYAAIDLVAPLGPDALLIVVPFYNKPAQQGQYDYFKAVAEYSPLPIVIYNVPGRTGANMLPDTVLRLAREVPGIIGIKEASGKYDQVSEIIAGAPEGFAVLSGDDDMTFAFMATGAHGVISVASNIAPSEVSGMTAAALSGDWNRARELHHRLFPLFKACFVESNPVPAKAALSLLGLCGSALRLPLSAPADSTFEKMKNVLDTLWK